jgi:hypothetical protein
MFQYGSVLNCGFGNLKETGSSYKLKLLPAACYLFHAGLFFYLFFDPEYGSDMSLRNVG